VFSLQKWGFIIVSVKGKVNFKIKFDPVQVINANTRNGDVAELSLKFPQLYPWKSSHYTNSIGDRVGPGDGLKILSRN